MVRLPASINGPLPALVLMHGSGGLQGATGDNIRKWADAFAGWGIASLVVDSFGPRGLTSTGADLSRLSAWAHLADAFAALKVLGSDPRIDRSRIGIVGWSRGGGAAFNSTLESLRKSMIKDELKFALHVAFYGPANSQYRDRATDLSPVMFLHGEADDYVPIGPVREFSGWLRDKGNPVTFVSYPKAAHDFDVERSPLHYDKNLEAGQSCDLVVELPSTRVLRMNHHDNPRTNLDEVRAYLRSCATHGVHLGVNVAARADAVEKVRAFLRQNFQLAR
jgi:dienelactone hydrolase